MSDDNWRWSRLRRDHNHILERKRNKGGWPDERLVGWETEGGGGGGRGAEKKGNCFTVVGPVHSMITANCLQWEHRQQMLP